MEEDRVAITELDEMIKKFVDEQRLMPWNEHDKAITASMSLYEVRERLSSIDNVDDKMMFSRSVMNFLFVEHEHKYDDMLMNDTVCFLSDNDVQ